MNEPSILQPVPVKIPADAKIRIVGSDGVPRPITAKFVDDYVIGNLCASAQHFGENLARRRVGHRIAAAFRGKAPGDVVQLPRALAFELWRVASESPYSAAHAVQLPESWLYAIPEVQAPPAATEAQQTDAPPPPDPNPPQIASEADAQALEALAVAPSEEPKP